MNFNSLDSDIALERQIRQILSTFQNVNVTQEYYQFRCEICGDSNTHKNKKRGYILKKKKPWVYYCQKCGYSKSVLMWMKEYHPLNYKDYFREILQQTSDKVKSNPLPKIENPKIRPRSIEQEHTKFFIPIMARVTPLAALAVKLCTDRLIPEVVWTKWFVAVDGKYKNRLVIPFFDNNGKIYNYQCRALYDYMIPKYLNRIGDKLNFVYNWYNVDKDTPVIVFEGIIDSIMMENSIAICGANKEVDLSKFANLHYLLDNDETGKKVSIKLLQEGKSVFIWQNFLKENNYPIVKDINELCINLNKTNKFTFDELKPYFTKSIYDEIFLL